MFAKTLVGDPNKTERRKWIAVSVGFVVVGGVLLGLGLWFADLQRPIETEQFQMERLASKPTTTSADIVKIAASDGEKGGWCVWTRGFKPDDMRAISQYLITGGRIEKGHAKIAELMWHWDSYEPSTFERPADEILRARSLLILSTMAQSLPEKRTIVSFMARISGFGDNYPDSLLNTMGDDQLAQVAQIAFLGIHEHLGSGGDGLLKPVKPSTGRTN
jgi:hypothetical protein